MRGARARHPRRFAPHGASSSQLLYASHLPTYTHHATLSRVILLVKSVLTHDDAESETGVLDVSVGDLQGGCDGDLLGDVLDEDGGGDSSGGALGLDDADGGVVDTANGDSVEGLVGGVGAGGGDGEVCGERRTKRAEDDRPRREGGS